MLQYIEMGHLILLGKCHGITEFLRINMQGLLGLSVGMPNFISPVSGIPMHTVLLTTKIPALLVSTKSQTISQVRNCKIFYYGP